MDWLNLDAGWVAVALTFLAGIIGFASKSKEEKNRIFDFFIMGGVVSYVLICILAVHAIRAFIGISSFFYVISFTFYTEGEPTRIEITMLVFAVLISIAFLDWLLFKEKRVAFMKWYDSLKNIPKVDDR